ncbi:MAG: hypothetical protein HY650_13240 [Acidobacteria bacterium]|nr:hypothetical protein [Acidobacteriota bacterium]
MIVLAQTMLADHREKEPAKASEAIGREQPAKQTLNCATPVECSSTGPALEVKNTGSGDGVSGFSGEGIGVFGKSQLGPGVRAQSDTGQDVIVGYAFNEVAETDLKIFSVEHVGNVRALGTFTSRSLDLAEMTEVEGAAGHEADSYQPADVLIIGTRTGKLKKSQQPYSPLVAGVYSTEPAFLGGQEIDKKTPGNKVPLALVRQVPCKVTTENGPIEIGDLLVTSSTPGHAMKGTDRGRMLGAIVGKALEPLTSGAGVIRVLLTLP